LQDAFDRRDQTAGRADDKASSRTAMVIEKVDRWAKDRQ
jgi:hypothetical protein